MKVTTTRVASVGKFALASHTEVGKSVGKCKGGKFALLLNFVLILHTSVGRAKKIVEDVFVRREIVGMWQEGTQEIVTKVVCDTSPQKNKKR